MSQKEQWARMKQIVMRRRAIQARNREMPKICDMLGMPRKPDMK